MFPHPHNNCSSTFVKGNPLLICKAFNWSVGILEFNTKMPSGEYKYVVNLTPLSNGFYLVSVKTDTQISTSKIIINK